MDSLDLIKKIVGEKNLDASKNITEENCQLYLKNVHNDITELTYKVYDDENIGFGYYVYHVYILIANNIIEKTTCTCHDYYLNKKCKHIAAVLFYNRHNLLNYNELEVSNSFLKRFSIPKQAIVRLKANLDLSFSFFNDTVKWSLKIGYDKLYSLNKNKLINFIDAYYNNKQFELGNQFIFSNAKYYFSEDESNILNYLFIYQTNKDPFILSNREFLGLTRYLNNIKFYIDNVGYFNKVEYNLPTKLFLEYDSKNKYYYLYFTDFLEYKFIDSSCIFIGYKDTLYVIPSKYQFILINLKKSLLEKITFKESDFLLFKEGIYKKIKDLITLDDISSKEILEKPIPNIYLDIVNNSIVCNVKFNYKDKEYDYFSEDDLELRDKTYENEIIKKIIKDKFIINKNYLIINDINLVGEFLANDLKELINNYKVYTSKRLDNTKIIKKSIIKSNFSIGQSGAIEYKFSIDNIDLDELNNVLKNLRIKKKYYRLRNGDIIDLLDNDNLNNFNNIIENLGYYEDNLNSGVVDIPKYKALYLDFLKEKNDLVSYDSSLENFINNFKQYRNININFSETDNINLRDYQKLGVKWLYTIYKCELGGILADEMGLGKTYQAICCIKEIIKENKDSKILIVTPTSLVYNWQKEFSKFASSINYICVYDNKKRRKEIIDNFDKYSVFITSYGLIRNDNDEYEDKKFDLCLIDEAQTIKNYYTELSTEIKKINARVKIALTGTPVENSVMELWNIFDFIMPGYLGDKKEFYEKYGINNIESSDLKRITNLRYLIAPFILRRKKSEVSKELPDKIEKIIYLDLTDMQKALYLKLLDETKTNINNEIKTNGFKASKLKILSLLMRLRQVCIDPKIIYENYKGNSIKLDKLLDIVKNLKKDNHKILIFSSFKTVIDNVSKMLEENSISSYKITGEVSSKDRINLVNKFNKDNTTCFLITLKSGGTGLNLTSADVVIHLDMWWNPQVEAQATDRAHRIGQNKKVTVLKLVTRGTLEEKIMTLQERKKILSDNLIEGNKNNTLFELSEEDIRNLLIYSNNSN